MSKQIFIMAHDTARRLAIAAVQSAPAGYVVRIQEATRSLDQNARLWALLTDISQQVDWYGQKLSPDEWKDVATAALKRQKVVPGIDGGFVVIGARTSKMSKSEMCELQEFLEAFGASHGVKFGDEGIAE